LDGLLHPTHISPSYSPSLLLTNLSPPLSQPKPKEIRFNSAADAINPPVPPPLPPKRNSISVQDEKQEKKVEINEEDEVKVLPIEVFSGGEISLRLNINLQQLPATVHA
jgi:hypothetical protein